MSDSLSTIAFWALWGPLVAAGAACYALALVCLAALVLSVPIGFLILVF